MIYLPIISLEIAKLSKEQKNELINEFTETASRITKLPKQSFVVLIKELPDENIGIGGESLEKIKEKNSQK